MPALSRLKSATVGFGLERLGLVSLRFPKITLILVAIANMALIGCALNLQFESDTRDLFRSKTADFAKFDDLTGLYSGFLNQVLLVVEGPDLKTAEGLEKLRSLHLDLEFIDDVARVVSLYSARHPPTTAKDKGRAFVPDPLDDTVDIKALHASLQEHPFVKNKLLTRDGNAALLIVTFNPNIRDLNETTPAIAEINATAQTALRDSGLTYAATGLPVVRSQVIRSLMRDQIVFIAAGISIGLMFSFMFFRDIRYIIITELPVLVSISGLLGGMWLTGQKVNVLSGMVTPLISVISLASTLHLAFAIRRALTQTVDVQAAITTAIKETGPGCVLSSITTALALIALTFAPFPFIQNFGLIAVSGALFALLSTLVTLPAAAYLILKTWPPKHRENPADGPLAALINLICRGSALAVTNARWSLTALGIIAVIGMGIAYLQNKPRYTSSENLPATSTAVRTIAHIDEHFSGSNRARLLLQWPEGDRFPTPEALDAIADAHKILTDQPWIKSVWSLREVAKWAQSNGLNQDEALEVIAKIKDNLAGQILTQNPNSALLTGYFPDINARALLPKLDVIETRLSEFRAKWPQIEASLTGVAPLEAVTSTKMINTLNWGLLSAIGLIILLIAIALRSIAAGVVSVVPNLLPIAVGGTYLYMTDLGLQFTSVVAFTIGFGMAVDSTIHYLNHYSLAKNTGLSTRDAIRQTTLNVGPVLVATTLIVSAGLGATLLSDLPLVKLYGEVSILVLAAALIADLIILPAIIAVVDNDET